MGRTFFCRHGQIERQMDNKTGASAWFSLKEQFVPLEFDNAGVSEGQRR